MHKNIRVYLCDRLPSNQGHVERVAEGDLFIQ